MNRIFYGIVALAFATAASKQLTADLIVPLHWPFPVTDSFVGALTSGALDASESAVTLAIGLVGYMAFFLGLMRVVEDGGGLRILARLLRPLMVRLFPEVPPNHPAMGAMILNMSANALGLANAATPFGIRAMQELETLNRRRGTATNAMALFLAINTSAVTLLPLTVIGIRASMGSADRAGIVATTLFATVCSTTVAIVVTKLLQGRFPLGPEDPVEAADAPEPPPSEPDPTEALEDHGAYPIWISLAALGALLAAIPTMLVYGETLAPWILPLVIVGLLTYGVSAGVPVYESFVQGAKAGFDVAITIIPYLVAILGAVGMLRGSGALDGIIGALAPVVVPLGMPAEALPMALIRPLSGSGAIGVLMDTLQVHGPDSFVGYLVSTLEGSTETTFYVIAVYYGAVQVRRIRHTMVAALCADAAGIIAAVVAVSIYWSLNIA